MKECKSFCKNGEFRGFRDVSIRNAILPFCIDDVYDELQSQFALFEMLTEGVGNTKHVDFHLWNNLRIPVAIAMKKLIKERGVQTARISSLQHSVSATKIRVMSAISSFLSFYKTCQIIPSCRLVYYLDNMNVFKDSFDFLEVFVHPDINGDGIVYDNTKGGLSSNSLESLVKPIQKSFEVISLEDLLY